MRLYAFVILLVAISGCVSQTSPVSQSKIGMDDIKWFGHSNFLFLDRENGLKIYYVDPFNFRSLNNTKVDIVFITHDHPDHCSSKDINSILTNATIVVSTKDCTEKLDVNENNLVLVEPNQELEIKGFKFKTVPAYNIKPERTDFHPKDKRWVGYIFFLNGKTVYHAGDTDFIPEMRNLGKIDLAILPIGGKYTMDVKEAIEAANTINASITIPMHYKSLAGKDYELFEREFINGVTGKAIILKEVS